MEKMKTIIKNVIDFLCNVLIYFVFLWSGVLAISLTYELPKMGTKVLTFSIIMVMIPKIEKLIKSKKL